MNSRMLLPIVVCVPFFIQACGSSALVKKEASDVVAEGKSAISEVNKYHGVIFDTQTQLAASLIARYPECNYGDSIVIRKSRSAGSINSLCLSDSELRVWQTAEPSRKEDIGVEIKLFPLEREALKVSMELLGIFAKYLESMEKFTDAPDTPISDGMSGLLTSLKAVDDKLKLLPATAGSVLAQSTAVTGFIQYIEKLAGTKNDAKAISEIFNREGEMQERNMIAVADEADLLLSRYVASMSATLTGSLGDYYNLNKKSKEFETLEKRQAFLVALFKQRQLDKQAAAVPTPAAKAIRAFVVAHQELRDSINGNYSDKQREFIRAENKKELKEALQSVTELAKLAVAVGF